jgi:hypothetical protein
MISLSSPKTSSGHHFRDGEAFRMENQMDHGKAASGGAGESQPHALPKPDGDTMRCIHLTWIVAGRLRFKDVINPCYITRTYFFGRTFKKERHIQLFD